MFPSLRLNIQRCSHLVIKPGNPGTVQIPPSTFYSSKASKGKDDKKGKMCSPAKQDKKSDSKVEKGKMCGPSKNMKEKGKVMCGGKTEEGSGEDKGISEYPRIGINGFGRIGRMVMRIAAEHGCPLEIVAVNDPQMKPEYMAYLLKYDSTHGRFVSDVEVEGKQLVMEGRKVCTYQEANPKNIPWKDLGVDYVIEASGKNTTTEKCQGHLDAGARHVVVAAPCKDNCPTFVVGVNLDEYETNMSIVSAASCATNALAPLTKVLHDKFGVVEGFMTTVHAITASQRILDQASQKNWRESRGGLQNMIPTYTGAAAALGKVLPQLQGKMTALSIRVPIPTVSMIDLTVRTKQATCLDEITKAMVEASDDSMLGIMDVTSDEIVSSDLIGSHYSVIYDPKASMELNKNFFKLIAWFDNEYGYTCRVIDLIKFMHAEAKEAENS
ncbi:glyceraldehyde-3-phosphate dehydrogenase-like [Macrosteles quadrilineatus]|uniref:glyceraldehyde-3-phosphate dehydrogenase-like n=1 Tax=Macrosteles quadrilineatus TaxID=74068 RepID=UPI0023E2D753|nr:glyceraldehyde-3-phosphate dehydrogenase-like [Macrosteles quadrilineatus]